MIHTIRCGSRILDLSRPHIMGVLNVTPDSFSDGGNFYQQQQLNIDHALRHAETMLREGASIIDVGGESTRPGAAPVNCQQELERVLPMVTAITQRLDVIISVDTSTPEVMQAAADAGAGMINDVRSLARVGALHVAAELDLPICLMHMLGEPKTMQDNPQYDDVTTEIGDFFRKRIAVCETAGIERSRLLIDPGFGFGKTLLHNLQLLNRLSQLAQLDLPILVGMSRKSMIDKVLKKSVHDRLYGGLALAVMALERGAHIVRVHDVSPTREVMHMAAAVLAENV
jgi:dihydropteroate synthase